ncbi:T6SS immunity protein Tdi1 domain-containing protein [Massilia aquatica]|uniref:DUF1851 domain-containing protein n=1 Tax=Massilia aquatica TaxID=2609000 RepID=A0ABX0MHT6_9BURK|nr:DUF1851 domain-containing protein [Massilia aquatica]
MRRAAQLSHGRANDHSRFWRLYGLVPALLIGGAATLEHLQKVKAVEHLVRLAQLAPLDVITSPPP